MNPWQLDYDVFVPEKQALREALCTLGNGYFATRGAAEESSADDVHYPGTYIAGGYNRLTSEVAGHTIVNEDFVNFPNWLCVSIKLGSTMPLNLMAIDVISFKQTLHMKQGVLVRVLHVRDQKGQETQCVFKRFVSMHNRHVAGLRIEITPLNWSGKIEFTSGIDGSILNYGVPRYRELNSDHLDVNKIEVIGDNTLALRCQTKQSRLEIALAIRHTTVGFRDQISPENHIANSRVDQQLAGHVEQQCTVSLDKILTLFTGRDRGISESLTDAVEVLATLPKFETLVSQQEKAWASLWRRCDVNIESSTHEQHIIRLHIFHLLQSVSHHSVDLDVGVPARGLHGEAYRGHIFWDELFIFPFYTHRVPVITRALLMYRYRRLDRARRLAKQEGFEGAMYPWQSGSNGQEETQKIRLNPRSNTWEFDLSRYQRHVNAAIAYNIWYYYQMTEGIDFLVEYGAEMILEIARFLTSLTHYNTATKRYEIWGVMGPDEYHEKYPDSDAPGVNNNAYTNVMTAWVLDKALETITILPVNRAQELCDQLGITASDRQKWQDISRNMTIPIRRDGIILQFEGYEALAELDWDRYREKYGNIGRMDRILKAEGDSPDRYQLSKQADVVMLFYLFPLRELQRIFKQNGYSLNRQNFEKNVRFYQQRTSHGSTLSKVVFASVIDKCDREEARRLFKEVLESDVRDTQGGTTPEGIHLGAMAGSIDIAMRHYAGVDFWGKVISFSPRLPGEVSHYHLPILHRGIWYYLDIDHQRFRLKIMGTKRSKVSVKILGKRESLVPGQWHEFSIV